MQLLACRSTRAAAARPAPARASRRAAVSVVAFKNGDDEAAPAATSKLAKVTFQLPLHVEWGQEVALVGAVDTLGSWEPANAVPLVWNDGDVWTAQAEVPVGTHIEYKYIIRAGEEAKEVVEWQPCDNLDLQAAAEQAELTVRDAWEGSHEVLSGTLPIPAPPAPAAEAAAEPAEAALPQAAVLEPAPVAIEAAAPEAALAEAAAVAEAAPEPPVITAEELAEDELSADEPAPPAAAAAAAAPAPAAAEAPAPEQPLTRSARGRSAPPAANGSKRAGGTSGRSKVVAAAAAVAEAPAVRYGSLSTNELKAVCKERGLSVKGQRRELLARLNTWQQQQQQA